MTKRYLSHLVRGISSLGICLILWSVLALRAGGDPSKEEQISEKEQELRRIRTQLEEKRQQTEELSKQEQSLLSRIKGTEERLDLAGRLVQGLQEKAKGLNATIDEIRKQIARLEEDLSTRRQILSERIREIYKRGPVHPLEILLSSRSLVDFSRRLRYLRLVAQQETKLTTEIRRGKEELQKRKSELEAQLGTVEKTVAEKKQEEESIAREAQERRRMLQLVKTERSAHLQAIEELEESSQKLQKIIDQLQMKREPIAGKGDMFEACQGRLIWPVTGKVISSFGKHVHPVFKTVTYHKGIDIQAPLGAEVRSVFQGTATYIGWLRGYGQFVILHHAGDYYTLYAHLSATIVTEGSQVREGGVIGRVGETGSLNGPKLYFEIRRGRQQLDPMDWLKKS